MSAPARRGCAAGDRDHRRSSSATHERVLRGLGWARRTGVAAALATLVGCGGCSPSYVVRSAWEEARILLAREPIEEMLARPDLSAEVKERLELVLAVRRYAADRLGLDVGGAYSAYSEVPPGALLHVLSAAEQTRLVPYTWWFPIVGRVSYKGYFDESEARAAAERLGAEGYDTWVRGTVAFSTLGWFEDPVLSSWMRSDDVRLADLLLHELLHRTTYVEGETDFNESFATFVGSRGAIGFFAERDGPDAERTERARRAWRETLARSQRVAGAVDRLRALYAEAAREEWPRQRTLEARRAIFAELGPPERVNNAVILAQLAYQKHLDRFERAATSQGGDLRETIRWVGELSEASEDPFAALASALGEPPAEVSTSTEAGTTDADAGAGRTSSRRAAGIAATPRVANEPSAP